MQEYRLEKDPAFVGRERELAWLEERLFFPGHWATPIVVTGVAGTGKTALVRQLLASVQNQRAPPWPELTPVWTDVASDSDAEIAVSRLISGLYDETRSSGGHEPRIVAVLDSVESLSDQQIEHATGRLFNLKRVRSVVLTSRRKPDIARAEVLTLHGLEALDAKRLLQQFAERSLSATALEEALLSTHGYPAAIALLARLLGHGGGADLSNLLSGPLYDLSGVIAAPPAEILTVAAPRIVSAREALVDRLRARPDSIYDLPPRKFEELLADLLSDMGWQVELTPATRDGGKDLLAYLDTDVGKLLCLVEAKKHRRDRKVGVDLVRTLYGTLCDYQANSAMLVTTSSFTPDAREFQRKHQYQLSLKDYGDVVEWIRKYKRRGR